jgi:hypothetical protein
MHHRTCLDVHYKEKRKERNQVKEEYFSLLELAARFVGLRTRVEYSGKYESRMVQVASKPCEKKTVIMRGLLLTMSNANAAAETVRSRFNHRP